MAAEMFHPATAFWQVLQKSQNVGEQADTASLVICFQGLVMKFTIEVVRGGEGGRHQVLHQTTVDEINPKRAKTRADQLLQAWRSRGATATRVLNHRGEELYTST